MQFLLMDREGNNCSSVLSRRPEINWMKSTLVVQAAPDFININVDFCRFLLRESVRFKGDGLIEELQKQ